MKINRRSWVSITQVIRKLNTEKDNFFNCNYSEPSLKVSADIDCVKDKTTKRSTGGNIFVLV